MKVIAIVQAGFVVASAIGVMTNGLASLARLGISVISFLIIFLPWVLTRVIKQKAFVRHVSLVWLAFHAIANNALMWYVLSEKGQQLGREQFGDAHEAKVTQLLSTFKANLPYIYGLTITLLNTDWWSVIPKTLVFLAASTF